MPESTPPTASLPVDIPGRGPPLVLLHSFPLDRRMWKHQHSLADIVELFLPDIPGFGGADVPTAPISVEDVADSVARMLDVQNVRDPIVLGGLSMGGYVALAFARKYPERLRGLILADTRAEPDDEPTKVARTKTIALARQHGSAGVVRVMLQKLLGPTTLRTRPHVEAEIEAIGSSQKVAGVIAALEMSRERPDSTPGLADIAVPTLLIVGDEDEISPLACAQTMNAKIRLSELARIPGVGHMSAMEDPESFNRTVRAWLERLL